jgi:hypothetical protein
MSERLDLDVDGEGAETGGLAATVPDTPPRLDDDRPADPGLEEIIDTDAAIPADEREVPLEDEP